MKRLSGLLILILTGLLLSTGTAWAFPVTGFFEARAVDGWGGVYAVQLSDGSVRNGAMTMTTGVGYDPVPLVTTGCVLSTHCLRANGDTQTYLSLSLTGGATLADLGDVTWRTQPLRVMAGDPSPAVAVLGDLNGWLGADTLGSSYQDFTFNSTFTGIFEAVPGGQILSGIRVDFSTGNAPPVSRTFRDQYGWFNIGVPVALGTGLTATDLPAVRSLDPKPIPEPSTLLLLSISLLGLFGVAWRRF